jgi:hypothetical protein
MRAQRQERIDQVPADEPGPARDAHALAVVQGTQAGDDLGGELHHGSILSDDRARRAEIRPSARTAAPAPRPTTYGPFGTWRCGMLSALRRGSESAARLGRVSPGSQGAAGAAGMAGWAGMGGVGRPVRRRERGCSPGLSRSARIKEFRGRAIGLVLGLGAIAASPAAGQQWWPVRGFERNGGLTQDVWCVETLSDGSLVFGGGFAARDGSPIHRIARWNGCSWDNMGGGFDNGTVRALAEFRGS